MPRQVIVIGGGLAGLTAALHLAERGLRPVLLEADSGDLGGRLAGRPGVTLPGHPPVYFPAEHGIHGFWSQYRNLKAMLARHAIRPTFVTARRQEWVHRQNGRVRRAEMGRVVSRTLWPAPFHYGALWFRPSFWRMVGWRDWLSIPAVLGSLVVAAGIDPLAEVKRMEGKTLADFCKGWPPAIRAFVASLARSGLSAHPEDVPLSGFLAFLRFYTLLRRDSQRFEYLAANPETEIIEPLAARIRELGGEVRSGCRAARLERRDPADISSGWKVYIESEVEPLECRQVVLAADAPGAAGLLRASPPTADLAAGLHWPAGLATAIVRLWFAAAPSSRAEAGIISGDFTADNFFWLHRIQTVFVEWHARTGGSALEAHIYGPPRLLQEPDEILLQRVEDDIAAIYPRLRGQVIHRSIRRNPATHTLFSVGSLADHLGIRTPWPGLYCCGDWVRHPSPALFLERACLTGIEAANAVLQTLQLPPFKLESPARPEWTARLTGRYVRMMRSSIRGT